MHPSENIHTAAVGIFDSGVGGLTVMQKIAALLPHEDIVYFGDTARIPYGDKTPEAITRYSIENAIFLMEQRIKILVVACNTASAYALEKLKYIFRIPVIGVIEAGVDKAVLETQNRHIAILGTRGTIRSGVYQQEIKKRLPDAQIHAIHCPLFVPLVEEQWLSHEATRLIIEDYLRPLRNYSVDTVLLGCTHYPLLRELIQQELGGQIKIVDSATSCAERVKLQLDTLQLNSPLSNGSNHLFFVSEDPEKFQTLGESFLGKKIKDVKLHKDYTRH